MKQRSLEHVIARRVRKIRRSEDRRRCDRRSWTGLRIAFALVVVSAAPAAALANDSNAKPPPVATTPSPPHSPEAAATLAAEQAKKEASLLLNKGNSQLDQAIYVEALASFEAAFTVYPSNVLHFNIAQTLYELGRPLDALHHYERYIAGVSREEGPDEWDLANERVFELRGKIANLDLQSNVAGATVVIDGRKSGSTPLNAPARLVPGKHVVLVDKRGYERRVIELDLRAGITHTERVELLTTTAALAQRQEFQRIEAARAAAVLRLIEEKAAAARSSERRRKAIRTAASISLGASAAAIATAAAAGTISWRESGKVEDASPGTPWAGAVEEHYNRANTYLRVFYVSAAVAGVAALTGCGLLLYNRRSTERASAPIERAALVPVLHAETSGGLAIVGGF